MAAILGLGATGCGSTTTIDSSPPASNADKLSAIDDSGSSADFQDILDCLTASGETGTETESEVSDTIVASWNQSSQQDTLYDWAQALASFYGC